MPALARVSARPSARLTAANAEARKPMTVRPSCDTARNRPGVVEQPAHPPRARDWPSSTSCSTRLRRIETSAISAATKKASRIVRTTRNRIAASGLITPLPSPPVRARLGRRVGPIGLWGSAAAVTLGRWRPRLADPRRHADDELARRHVTGDDRARPGPRLVAQGHRRAEHRVDAQEHALADRRAVLRRPVVVGRDRARAHVRVRAHVGVAEVAVVVLAHVLAEAAVLELREVADLGPPADVRPRPQVAERARS